MVIAGVVDVVRAMRKGIIPSEMGTGRIIALMRQGEKIIFGDSEGVAWRMMMMGAVISTETGFWHDRNVGGEGEQPVHGRWMLLASCFLVRKSCYILLNNPLTESHTIQEGLQDTVEYIHSCTKSLRESLGCGRRSARPSKG